MSQSVPTGYIPPDNPWGLAQKTCPGGRDLTFEGCPGAGNLTRTRILWKMKVKLQKIAWIKFLQVKTKNKLNFLPFSRFTFFSMKFFLVYGSIFLVLLSHIPYKKSEELPLACLYLKFSLGHGYPHLLCTKGYDYVKRFVRVLVSLVTNTGCPKKLLKMGNTALLISSSNYAKTPYKCVHKRQFVFLVF